MSPGEITEPFLCWGGGVVLMICFDEFVVVVVPFGFVVGPISRLWSKIKKEKKYN